MRSTNSHLGVWKWWRAWPFLLHPLVPGPAYMLLVEHIGPWHSVPLPWNLILLFSYCLGQEGSAYFETCPFWWYICELSKYSVPGFLSDILRLPWTRSLLIIGSPWNFNIPCRPWWHFGSPGSVLNPVYNNPQKIWICPFPQYIVTQGNSYRSFWGRAAYICCGVIKSFFSFSWWVLDLRISSALENRQRIMNFLWGSWL